MILQVVFQIRKIKTIRTLKLRKFLVYRIFYLSLDLSSLPTGCRSEIEWDFEEGRKKDAAESWFGDMKAVVGVGYEEANIYDFVRFYKCADRKPKKCSGIFWPDGKCSKSPCDKCLSKRLIQNWNCVL